jgi:hypothetical protein
MPCGAPQGILLLEKAYYVDWRLWSNAWAIATFPVIANF